uniref:Polypeptide N-acetylgalactosaminyltransferase n=1 Tax=Ciona intestinalis TaxID=7719 RepID=F6R554_CIOIN|nr:N-acetylgalactosaminyltransferase 7-like isoform X1 [Ciona intestinalis]|eukprot:XP_002128971.1 N-acetylgalactosaminyltransferase 7-like isoform X1 [Ciona intestinalis]
MRFKIASVLKFAIALAIFYCAFIVLPKTFKKQPPPPFERIENEPQVKLPDSESNNLEFPAVDGVEVDLQDGSRHLIKHIKFEPNEVVAPIKPVVKEDFSNYPQLNWRKLGNYEESLARRNGPGEYGVAVHATNDEKEAVAASIKEFGFNMVNSDKISLDRLPKDLRHDECRHWDYPSDLPDVSVIIVFHNEGWSTLVRTVHSVINLTPKKLLYEIVMIDDHSNKEHLGQKLTEYIQRFNGLVKLYRNERREGLIRARSIGAQKSTPADGRVLVYLDAHCEVGYNWLPPLIMPIVNNRKVTTVPLIDVINGQDYTFTSQAGGDANGFARGAWDWSMLWKRVPLTKEEHNRRKHTTDPYRSPAMAGGLFAIERQYFFDIGLYDPGLEIWGGENFEMSFKIWMCEGEVLFVPCSRVGHVYRLPGWSGNPPPEYVPSNPSLRNYIRVVETWWDEYKDYFYASRPETLNMPYGDISAQVKYRQEHNCKSFKWFMENIAYDIVEHYPLPPKNKEWGEVRGVDTNQCLDSMGHKNGDGALESGYCHRMGGNQLFRLSEANQLAQYDQCVTIQRGVVTVMHCDTTQFREWDHDLINKSVRHTTSGKCLERGELVHKVFLALCDANKPTQRWEINQIQSK